MGLDRKSYFTLIQHILQTASRNCVAEAKIPFCRIIGRREKDHEVLYPGLISLPTCGHCLRADGFEQSSRSEAQDRRMLGFRHRRETCGRRAGENRDGTASKSAGFGSYHLCGHRREWPVRVEGNRSGALLVEGKPHRLCHARVWAENTK